MIKEEKDMRIDKNDLLIGEKEENTKELKDTVLVNKQIIASMITQKSRLDDVLNKSITKVKEEATLPPNTFLDWTKIVDPFLENVITSKLMDFQIIKAYQKFTRELVIHDSEFNITRDEVDYIRDINDFMISVVIALEKKIIGKDNKHNEILIEKQIKLINFYQDSDDDKKVDDDKHCVCCGGEIEEETIGKSNSCHHCDLVPDEFKPEDKKKTEEETNTKAEEVSEPPKKLVSEEKIEEANKKNDEVNDMINEIDSNYDNLNV